MDVASIHEALAFLNDRPRIVAILTWTRPPLLERNRRTGQPNPYPMGVEKIVERFGMIGVNYENAVNNQRLREGQPTDANDVVLYFHAEELWKGLGEGVPGSRYLVRHRGNGKLYLAFMPRNVNGVPLVGTERWRDVATGRNLNPADLTDFLPLRSHSRRQQTDKEIFWRTVAIENVLEIRSGEVYRIAA